MNSLKPTSVTADRQAHTMTVTWNDEHTSVYSFTLLRNACPCAECRGGHANMGSDPDPEVFNLSEVDIPATRIRNLEAVGTYGLTIEWEDGHHYGIFTWEFLKKLCPCPICQGG